MSGDLDMMLIVGLGNPGVKYEKTRHNVGFAAIDALCECLAKRNQADGYRIGSWKEKGDSIYCEATTPFAKLLIIKPQTFMNLSGRAVAVFQRFYKVPLKNVVVIHDEVELQLGRLQIKAGGGDAGHNGLKSLRAELGGGDFVRIRCGVGRPQKRENGEDAMVQWVLGTFSADDRSTAEEMFVKAAEASLVYCEKGLVQAQRDFNRRA